MSNDQCHKLFDLFRRYYRARFFSQSFGRPSSLFYKIEAEWIEYLKSIGCSRIDREELMKNFVELVNVEHFKDLVCIPDPSRSGTDLAGTDLAHRQIDGLSVLHNYVLVPRELALRVLVLGDLP